MLVDNFKYISKWPQALLDDITSNRCIPFIGSGFSKNAKTESGTQLPDWKELGDKAANYLDEEEPENAVEALSQFEQAYSRANLIELVAAALHINDVYPGDAHLSFCKLYFDLICTTNYDFLLEDAFSSLYTKRGKPFHVISNENRLSTSFDDKTTILKLHGDFNDPSNMVITEGDYDSYISRNPLLCTYIANLLITRTPLLIGYSLNDPDLRMIWNIIGNRLASLRRTGYALVFSPSEKVIARFKRRGINVIALPDTKEGRDVVFTKIFDEILEYWNSVTEKSITTSNEDALSMLKIPNDANNNLCLFCVPFGKLSLYKKYIFPIVEQYRYTPITADEFILPGDNISAKMNLLIQKASIVIMEPSPEGNFNSTEYGIIRGTEKPCLIVIDGTNSAQNSSLYHRYIVGNFTDRLEDLLNEVGSFIKEHPVTDDLYDEPKRLFKHKEYNAAIISAIKLLEIRLTKEWLLREKGEHGSSAVIPLTQLIKIVGNQYGVNTERVLKWASMRNRVVHSEYRATREKCKEIVEGVYELIAGFDSK